MEATEDNAGAWMKKRVDPSAVDDSFKDGYVDMLAGRRSTFSDLSWALKKIPKTATYKYKHERNYEKLNQDVLHSDRVSFVIEQISKETGSSKVEVSKEAENILTAMAHRFNMASVRALGYPLMKVLKRLHDHIYINAQGLSMINDLVQEYPVLLVPSHRSYFDFIILSLMCYDYDLPLPAIVAAQDFMDMFLIGSMLRNSGAFYIKRSFRSDKLYWAIFTEYVQTQLYNGDHPIEFFVEGTRSRTQKCYAPKLGMLAGSLEAYFKGLVPDIMIVPISISYDRVLEENLFAQELLGIPKPKESTSKLFKVFSILNENYGNIHVSICPPISARKMATGRIDRLPHSLEPRFMSNITEEEEKLVEEIGYAVLWQHQKNMVLSVWCLIAAVLLQNRKGISVSNLTETIRWLKRHANNVGAYIDWPGSMSDEEVVLSCLNSHKGFVELADSYVRIAAVDHGSRLSQSKHIKGETIADAATHMVLVIYRNQMVHAFVPYSLLSMIITKSSATQKSLSRDDAFKLFSFAVKIFANEFILDQNSIPEIFDNAMQVLEHTSDVVTDDRGAIILDQSVTRFTTFLSNMLLPFVTGYWALCKYIQHTTVDMGIGKEPVVRPKKLVLSTQYFILDLINQGFLNDYELLNLDILNNALTALRLFKVVYNEVRNGEKFVAAKIPSLTQVTTDLENIAVIPRISDKQLQQSAVSAALKAKL